VSGLTLPTEAWMFLIAQAFLFGGLWAVTRYRVTQLEKGQEKTDRGDCGGGGAGRKREA
jgi:hypothetical protein